MSAENRDRVMGHGADNDGIEEYDNKLPDWWLGLLFFTILWAVGYTVDYHFVSKRSQTATYLAEVDRANARWPAVAAAATFDTSPFAIEAGRQIFAQNCVACHGAEMLGGIGPNLVDTLWIHGGSLPEIAATITNGVPEKGMLKWGPILGPDKISKVTAYIYTSGVRDGG